MGARPQWRRPKAEPGAVLALLEVVASESPDILPFAVESLAASPARLALLGVVEVLDVAHLAELVERTARAVGQLDRLEVHPRWTNPDDVFGADALPAAVLSRLADVRAGRLRGRLKPATLRVQRRLRAAASRERAAALVHDFLSEPPRK